MKRKQPEVEDPASHVATPNAASGESGSEEVSGEKEKDETQQEAAAPAWVVCRLGSKGEVVRKQEEKVKMKAKRLAQPFVRGKGLSYSDPGKQAVKKLLLTSGGVGVVSKGGLFGNVQRIFDYNHFRTMGHRTFEKNTNNRAVSVSTVSAYDQLRRELQGDRVTIKDGDLGENLILDGPQWQAGAGGLSVGTVLRIGEKVEIEITEANEPCYRCHYLPFAAWAKQTYNAIDPSDSDFRDKWWNGPSCVLSKEGGRGWFAKVLVEGDVHEGDSCTVIEKAAVQAMSETI
jgi:hypothetical protein